MMNIKKKNKKSEVLFWSIAFPGFGQLLNRKYVKGFILIALEFLINIKGKINIVIIQSFLGEMELAINQANYQWLMFYPCIYLFAIWDAYKDAAIGTEGTFTYIPFVFSAYTGTIGVIYSSTFTMFDQLIGPIFLPIISIVIGFIIGYILKIIINSFLKSRIS